MGALDTLLKILGAAAPVAKAIYEDVASAAKEHKQLKAENDFLIRQIELLKTKLFVSTLLAILFGISFIAVFTLMLWR
jgi:cell division protein FtsB